MSEINYKIILIGNSGVGKTTIFKKLETGEFEEKNISTIGMEKKDLNMNIEVNNNGKKETKTFFVTLFDTSGQEKFRAVTFNYYKGSNGVLLIYDITSKESFDNVSLWVDSIKEAIDSNEESKYAVILIGNKLDLAEQGKREVTEEEAKDICKQYNLIWGGEQSTKDITLDRLTELFGEYVEKIYNVVGEKKVGKRKEKKMKNYKKKSKCQCF